MEENKMKKPTYLFEVSWEVCNKVGGIHTVISTKALNMVKEYSNNHILIGPDVWRSIESNPEFIDDPRLFKSWRAHVAQDGLRVKVGRWNVAGMPIVILVDFTTFTTQKDKIFSDFWEKYRLDSISGQWDYIEPALFGYAAGKVIESFVNFSTTPRQRIIAQFHEWMTGSGLLYLKQTMPQVGCVFTTHATVLGRCVAGNNLPLYGDLENYVPDELARRFNVVSKQSLEKVVAENADCFTTVSDITAKECAHFLGKNVDIVTPNGFENVFTPTEQEYDSVRKKGRNKLLQVASTLLGKEVSDSALLVGIGGRYEYKNKGIDVYIEALGALNHVDTLQKEVVAFILVPSAQKGVNEPLVHNLNNPDNQEEIYDHILTHVLENEKYDSIINKISSLGLDNTPNNKVKIIFVPSYLNGNDGVFNMTYYNLLIGMDLTVFPSYYEPWGYTPLESLAFKVPTITTTLAGFGLWVKDHYLQDHPSIEIVKRTDDNNEHVVNRIVERIKYFTYLNDVDVQQCKENAKEVANIALWNNLVIYYKQAYDIALSKADIRLQDTSMVREHVSYIEKLDVNTPNWNNIMIQRSIPEKLAALEIISKNLWWCWNDEAREVFRYVDYDIWREVQHNPIALLDTISYNRLAELQEDEVFMQKLESVYANFQEYMAMKDKMSGAGVAYFCMEYGINTSLKIYSGGLGILAGDYLKEASDKGVKMTAIGLLYRYGYFTQKLSARGEQEALYDAQQFMQLPITPVHEVDGTWVTIPMAFPGRTVNARVWRVDVGRVELYLLDTDFEDNLPEDRSITHHLYGGDWENRLKQELLLGCGGVRVLRKMGIDATIYHCNEGHAAFCGIERLAEFINEQNMSFAEAMELVRSSSVFTTHTPVPAGHDAFSENLLRSYVSHFTDRLKINWEQLLGLGKISVHDPNEKFSMSFLAANLSQEINGVSMLHGEVSRDIFKGMWPGYFPEELNITYVTNGVHYPTWTAPEWKEVEAQVFGDAFQTHHYDKSCFDGIYKVSDTIVADIRRKLRKRLINHILDMMKDGAFKSFFTPRQMIKIQENLRDDVLTIGFARRFATYKRAHLLFRNLDRLSEIVNNPEHPVQFLFAGKAHPADKAGQDLIKNIVEISKMPQFIGKILFLPNYDISLAKKLVQGVDIWMNTPTRPLEASGTSGEKAAMNGVMHFSVLDGWWVEGYRPDAGWMLPQERSYEKQEYQDELDSEMIYNIIDDEIAPMFYCKENSGEISSEWISYVKNTIAKVASNFTTNRMLDDYERQFYLPMAERYEKMKANNYAMAIEIAAWKKKVTREWDNIEVVDSQFPVHNQLLLLGVHYEAWISLEIGDLSINDIGVEMIVTDVADKKKILDRVEYVPVEQVKSVATYKLETVTRKPGMYNVAVRMFPKSDLLAHRMDFALVKWL